MNSKEVFALRREGKNVEALTLARSLIQSEPDNVWNARALAWTLFDAIKPLSPETPGDADRARLLAAEFLRDSLPHLELPSLEFSVFVGSLCPFAIKTPELGQILVSAGVKAFSAEDVKRRPGKADHGDFPSLLEKVTQAMHKRLSKGQRPLPLAPGTPARKYIEAFLHYVKPYESSYKDNIWFTYWRGTLLKAVDRQDEALESIKRIVREKPQDFWAWEQFALFHPLGSQERLRALCRARMCRPPEEFSVTLRQHLAESFIEAGRLENARAELAELHHIRNAKGWKDTSDLIRLQNQLGAGPSIPIALVEMRNLAEEAESDLVPASDWTPALSMQPGVDEQKRPYHMILIIWQKRPSNVRVYDRKFPALKRVRLGDPLRVVAEENEGRILIRMLKLSDHEENSLLRHGIAALYIHEKGFGFLDKVFVPARVISEMDWQNGQTLAYRAVASWDQTKQCSSWILLDAIAKEVALNKDSSERITGANCSS